MTFDPLVPVVVLIAVAALAGALAVVRWRRSTRRGAVVRSTVLVALVLMVALDPAIGGGHVVARASNVDVLFVVDTTGSIAAEDYAGGRPRIDGVRVDVRDLGREFAGARFSMITFDTVARLEMPWTTDIGALEATAAVIRQERTYNSRGSRIDIALDLIEVTLRHAREAGPDRRQVLFFLSDGEQTADVAPRSFRRLRGAIASGAVFGYGTEEGGPMLRYTSAGYPFDDYVVDYDTGEPALSHIDEDNLRTVADELGVRYRHRTSEGGLEGIAADVASAALSNDYDARPGARRLYWIPALGIVALALWQMVAVAAELDDVRRMTRRSA